MPLVKKIYEKIWNEEIMFFKFYCKKIIDKLYFSNFFFRLFMNFYFLVKIFN